MSYYYQPKPYYIQNCSNLYIKTPNYQNFRQPVSIKRKSEFNSNSNKINGSNSPGYASQDEYNKEKCLGVVCETESDIKKCISSLKNFEKEASYFKETIKDQYNKIITLENDIKIYRELLKYDKLIPIDWFNNITYLNQKLTKPFKINSGNRKILSNSEMTINERGENKRKVKNMLQVKFF